MNSDDNNRRAAADAKYAEMLRKARANFARGVNANRSPAPTIACAGCAKTLAPVLIAAVTPYGALCAECNAGLADNR